MFQTTIDNAKRAVRNGFTVVQRSFNSTLGIGKALKGSPLKRRSAIKSGPLTFARGNLQREVPPRKARKAMAKRSPERQAEQDIWNSFTQIKIDCGRGCQRCGRRNSETTPLIGHHFLPKGRGGKSTWDNHVLLDPICHRWVHDFPEQSAAAGLLASGKKAITPVTTRKLGEVA